MNYTSNQVRQFYVADGYTADSTAKGQISKVKKLDGEDEIYFIYNGPDTPLRSDFIPLKNVTYAKAIKAEDMEVKMRKISVELASDPVAGQDYVLGINFKNFFSSGDDSQYYKDAAVHVTSDISTKAAFATAMVDALNAAFSREDGATSTSNPYLAFSASGAKIIIEEKEQDWTRDTKKQQRIRFDVFPGTIYVGGDDINWAKKVGNQYYTEETPTTTVGNGKALANMEWFYLGERGDQYRMMGYPNYIPTKYLVDETKTYHVIEIHYAFTDTGVNSYRTEKELTIVVPAGTGDAKYTAVNAVIGAINTAAGSTLIATLADQ